MQTPRSRKEPLVRRFWDAEAIGEELPGIDKGFPAIINKLESLGLAHSVWDVDGGQPCWVPTVLGRASIAHLKERAGLSDDDAIGRARK
jgi:hypothetical protein